MYSDSRAEDGRVSIVYLVIGIDFNAVKESRTLLLSVNPGADIQNSDKCVLSVRKCILCQCSRVSVDMGH